MLLPLEPDRLHYQLPCTCSAAALHLKDPPSYCPALQLLAMYSRNAQSVNNWPATPHSVLRALHTAARVPPRHPSTGLPCRLCRRLLFLGGVDAAVRVLLRPPGGEFKQQCTLKGHDNWVSGLAATQAVGASGTPLVLVASASQDRTARLWRLTCTDTAAPAQAAPVRLPPRGPRLPECLCLGAQAHACMHSASSSNAPGGPAPAVHACGCSVRLPHPNAASAIPCAACCACCPMPSAAQHAGGRARGLRLLPDVLRTEARLPRSFRPAAGQHPRRAARPRGLGAQRVLGPSQIGRAHV